VSARWWAQAWAVARKDLLLEARSRERLVITATFAVLVAVVFSFALDPTVRARSIGGAMIWVTVLFAGTLGLGRSFALERENDALAGLVVSPVDRGALFVGKMAANLVLVLATEALVFPAYGLFFGLTFGESPAALAGVVVLATVGFICLGTLFSAIAAHTRLGDTLMPILLLPLLVPVIIFAASATQRLMVGRPPGEVAAAVRMLLAFDLVYLVLCPVLFGAVLEE
jgi:heme exporter protein B